MTMPAIRLPEQAQRFHLLRGQKLPPTRKEYCRVVFFMRDLGDRAARETDGAVMSIQDENSTKSQMQNVSQDVGKVHSHDFRANADRATKMGRVGRTLGEHHGREQ